MSEVLYMTGHSGTVGRMDRWVRAIRLLDDPSTEPGGHRLAPIGHAFGVTRPAIAHDVPLIAELAQRKREPYAIYQQRFWRVAANAVERHPNVRR